MIIQKDFQEVIIKYKQWDKQVELIINNKLK